MSTASIETMDQNKISTVYSTPKENKIKSSVSRKIFVVFNYTLLTVLAIVFILPVIHVFFSSISDPYWLNTKSGLVLYPHGIVPTTMLRLVLPMLTTWWRAWT
jgi:putative aldouronate transport system permease protein